VTERREAVLAAVASLEGWMTSAQGERLWDVAAGTRPGGAIAEIGSYRGKSAIVLASAAPLGVTVTAIDPHAGNDRGPQQIRGEASEGEADHVAFLANLAAAGVAERVQHLRLTSHEASALVAGPLDLLYIDGAHRFGPAQDDLVRWGAKVAPGGTMLVHDAYSSIGVTLALLATTVGGRSFRYEGRDGSLARYRREELRGRARLANTGRQLVPLAWFVRNVVVKVLLVCRLAPIARLLGHDGETWPY
jgi:predicted O-methyltransferase YrrM